MKIIGTNGRESCIVVLTKDELAQLNGFYSAYGANERGIKMEPCAEVPVSTMYSDATFLINAYGEMKKDLAQNQARLAKLAEMLNRPLAEKGGAK